MPDGDFHEGYDSGYDSGYSEGKRLMKSEVIELFQNLDCTCEDSDKSLSVWVLSNPVNPEGGKFLYKHDPRCPEAILEAVKML